MSKLTPSQRSVVRILIAMALLSAAIVVAVAIVAPRGA